MKKGISLIVLVVTIIVIIILAGAVILSLTNNNPIAEANEARYKQDKEAVQSALTMFLAKKMAVEKDTTTITGATLATIANKVVTPGDAKYAVGGGVERAFDFTTESNENFVMKLPQYDATWGIDSNTGIVSLTVNGKTY